MLSKPGTDGLEDAEAKNAYIEDLAKRSVESLRDSVSDLSEEYKMFLSDAEEASKKANSKKGGVDLSGSKLTSPTLSAGRTTSSSQPVTSDKHSLADKAFGLKS